MPNVVIAHPLEFLSAGMEAILLRSGAQVSSGWGTAEIAFSAAVTARADTIILARSLIAHSVSGQLSRPMEGCFGGRIIIVLERDGEFTTKDFITLDVDGLILDSATGEDLVECVDSVCRGRQWIDPHIRSVIALAQKSVAGWSELSSRELEVAQLAAGGLSNKEIARTLNVADGTVKMHMHHILSKLHLGSRVDIIRDFLDVSGHLDRSAGREPPEGERSEDCS